MDISAYRRQLEWQTKELLLDLWNGQNDSDKNPLIKAWSKASRDRALVKIPALIQRLQDLKKALMEDKS